MKRATHYIEVYKNRNGLINNGGIISIKWFHLLGIKVIGWETIAIFRIKYKKNEGITQRIENN